ncbi:MAG: pyruvate ferredoxin oxidoreductase [Nitrospina sp.]|nr:pyruvate ferredoxin oxidoreductase [Nitrospina sp.]
MYNVAYVHDDKCIAEKGCRLCIMYCPEADCILLDTEKMKASVVTSRCKGCDLCKVVCSTHQAISMHPVNSSTGEILIEAKETQAAGMGQAYAG